MLLKFRERDTEFAVSRERVKKLSAHLEMSETAVIHLALASFAKEQLPAYEPDDGPLSASSLRKIRAAAKKGLAKGEVISRTSMFKDGKVDFPS
jgi:hypothetical protein